MNSLTASEAKQRFGDLLDMASRSPVSITRHGQEVAVVHGAGAPDAGVLERRLARSQQALVEADRLIRHQRMALRLLGDARAAKTLVAKARAVVDQWEQKALCSRDFIDRWRALLALPLPALAAAMSENAEDGWGPALRQNSPWVGLQ